MEEKNEKAKNIAIKQFIQKICTPTTFHKRLNGIKKLFKMNFNWTFEDYVKIWKGIFYAVWYTEMGKGCEQLITQIADYCQHSRDLLISGFDTLAREWHGIDYIRVDKFAYFARHLLSSAFKFQINLIKSNDSKVFDNQVMKELMNVTKSSKGLLLHVVDIYIDELRNNLENNLREEEKLILILQSFKPFEETLEHCTEKAIIDTILERVYLHIEMNLLVNESKTFNNDVINKLINNLFKIASKEDLREKTRNIIYGLIRQLQSSMIDREHKTHKMIYDELLENFHFSGKRKKQANNNINSKKVKCTRNVIITEFTDRKYNEKDKQSLIKASFNLPFKMTITCI